MKASRVITLCCCKDHLDVFQFVLDRKSSLVQKFYTTRSDNWTNMGHSKGMRCIMGSYYPYWGLKVSTSPALLLQMVFHTSSGVAHAHRQKQTCRGSNFISTPRERGRGKSAGWVDPTQSLKVNLSHFSPSFQVQVSCNLMGLHFLCVCSGCC